MALNFRSCGYSRSVAGSQCAWEDFFFSDLCIWPVCMLVYHMSTVLREPEEGVGSPRTGVTVVVCHMSTGIKSGSVG